MMSFSTAENWIYSRLRAVSELATVDIRAYPADEATQSGIVWKFVSAEPDVKPVGMDRIKTVLQYQIAGYSDGDGPDAFRAANRLAELIDEALDQTMGANSYGIVHACERIRPYQFVERSPKGAKRTVIGAFYRISVCGK